MADTPQTGSGHAREIGGGFIPRYAKSCATAGGLGADEVTQANGQNAVAFRVGLAGDVVLTTEQGHDVTFYSVQVGELVCLAFSAIKQTGTTAQKITYFFQ